MADFKIRNIKWLGEGEGSHQREPAPPSRPQSPQAAAAEISPQPEASTEDETFTPEMIAKRREILEKAGSGTPNWDGARYRSLMDEAGIPHSDSLPEPHPPSPDADSPTAETNNTTSTPPARAGESWTEAEDDLLIEQVRAGANLNDIVRKHSEAREQSAVASRSSISSPTTPKSSTSLTGVGRSMNSPGPSVSNRTSYTNDSSAAASTPNDPPQPGLGARTATKPRGR